MIKCQEPTGLGFDDWTSSIKYDAKNYKVLSQRNLCLRGSILRSTDYAVGIVIYVGMDTKIYADRRAPERKKSWLLDQMHKAVITLLIFLLIVNLLMTFAGVYFKREINYPYLVFDNE